MLVPNVLVGTVEGLIFRVIALTSMMKGKGRLGQHLELGDHGDQDHFSDQQYNNGTRGSQSTPKGKGEGKLGKGGKGKGGKGKGFGSEMGVLDSHFGWQGTHPVRLEPLPELGSHLQPFRAAGSSPSGLFRKGHQKLGHDPSHYRTGSMS